VTLAASTVTADNAVLAQLDPAAMQNGAYTLRLTAADISGRTTRITRVIEINTAAKGGALATSATDATITLAGAAFAITRNYSSLDAETAGLLGYGWHVAGLEPRVATNVTPTGAENEGVYAAFTPATRVYMNLPDGTRAGFTFTPTRHEHAGVVWYSPVWTPDAGVTFQLASAAAVLELVNGSFLERRTGLPYNPESGRFDGSDYTLVAPDGWVYRIDAAGGTEGLTAPGGARLVVSDSGIVADDGSRVSFQWDHAGRLAVLTGADGTYLAYTYDAAGDLINVTDVANDDRSWYGYDVSNPHHLAATMPPAGQTGLVASYGAGGALLASETIDGVLGNTRQFIAAAPGGTLAAGQTLRYVLMVSDAELGTTASGRLTIGVRLTPGSGQTMNPATMRGVTAGVSGQAGGDALSLFTIDAGGLYVLDVTAGGAAGAGNFTMQVTLGGDVNSDGAVDGIDDAAMTVAMGASVGDGTYNAAADVDGDGTVDAADRQYLNTSYGFVANHAPAAADTGVMTHVDLPMAVDLSTFATDAEGDRLYTVISGAINGTVDLSLNGQILTFTPAAGFSGTASFTESANRRRRGVRVGRPGRLRRPAGRGASCIVRRLRLNRTDGWQRNAGRRAVGLVRGLRRGHGGQSRHRSGDGVHDRRPGRRRRGDAGAVRVVRPARSDRPCPGRRAASAWRLSPGRFGRRGGRRRHAVLRG